MDAMTLLESEHAQLARLFDEYADADPVDKRKLALQIRTLVALHSQIEEELLYPEASRALAGEDFELVVEGLAQHEAMRTLARDIEGVGVSELTELDARVHGLEQLAMRHIEAEEHELFHALEYAGVDSLELGERLEARRACLLADMFVRPEPATPGTDAPGSAGTASRVQ